MCQRELRPVSASSKDDTLLVQHFFFCASELFCVLFKCYRTAVSTTVCSAWGPWRCRSFKHSKTWKMFFQHSEPACFIWAGFRVVWMRCKREMDCITTLDVKIKTQRWLCMSTVFIGPTSDSASTCLNVIWAEFQRGYKSAWVIVVLFVLRWHAAVSVDLDIVLQKTWNLIWVREQTIAREFGTALKTWAAVNLQNTTLWTVRSSSKPRR